MKKRLGIFLLLAACVLTRAAATSAGAEKPAGDLTVLVYMTGSDLESRSGEACRDLEEMVSAMPADSGMSVAVLTGGAAEWHNDIPADRNCLWQILPGGRKLLEDDEQQNMGDAETLSAFLQRGAELLPAERYALILWDHGGGPLNGVCFDERYNMDGLSLEELAKGLQDSPFAQRKLMFIGFDACLMASIETACAVSPFAEVMIASQEPEPGEGWDYAFLPELARAADGAEAGEIMVRAFAASQEESLSPVSLSCLDLSRAEAVQKEIGSLFGGLADGMTEEDYPVLAQCRVRSRALGESSFSEWDLVDLIDLADKMGKQGAADTAKLLEEAEGMILRNYASEKRENGLSIYAPFSNKPRYSQPWSDRYGKMDFADGYRRYVQRFAEIWLGKELIDWRNRESVEAEMERNEVRLALPLEEKLAENTAYARLLILQTGFGPADEYSLVYASEALQPVNGMLRATYSGEALYLLNGDGEVLDGPFEPRPLEGGVALYAVVEDINWKQEGVYLLWQKQEDGTYALTGIETYNQGQDMFTMSSRKPMEGDTFLIGGYVRKLPESETDYQDWPWGETILYCQVPYTEGTQWKLRYLPMNSEYERYAVFEIVDLQGNTHLSEMIPLNNPDRFDLSVPEQTVRDNGLKLTLKEASILTGSLPCIQAELDVEGRTAEPYLQTILLNRTALSGTRNRWDIHKKDDMQKSAVVTITANDLQKAGIRKIETLTLVFSVADQLRTFSFDFPVDAGMIALPEEEKGEPLFTGEKDGFAFEILSLEKDVYGNLTGRMHVINRSGRNRRFANSTDACVNGEWKLYAYLEKNGISETFLPDGYDLWCDYQIDTQGFEQLTRKEIADIDPEQVRQIQLEMKGPNWKNLFEVELN